MGESNKNTQLYQVIFESSVEGILVIDDAGRITRANPALEKMFGYGPGELEQLAVETLIPGNSRELHRELRNKYLQNPEARNMGRGRDVRGIKKNGTEFPVEVSLSPATINGRSVVIAFIADITGRSKIMEALMTSENRMAEVQGIAHVGSWYRDLKNR